MHDSSIALLPQPIQPEYDQDRFIREAVQGQPVADEDKDTVQIHGYCAGFCGTDVEVFGRTVAEHGPFCTSTFIVWSTDGVLTNGHGAQITGELVAPYHFGVYRKEDMPLPSDTYLRLEVADRDVVKKGDAKKLAQVFLPAGELRRIAAALVYAADEIDGLSRPLRRENKVS